MNPVVSRRGVLLGGGLCTLAICGVAGCTSYGPEEEPAPTPAAPLTVPTADIPVGAGKIFNAEKIVITQPSAGQFKAFSAICTHQGCTVGEVTTTINCPCHGSRYSITDGSVVNGPATAALMPYPVAVRGSEVTVT